MPLDRTIAVGAGVESKLKGFEVHTSLNYLDLGDGKIDQTAQGVRAKGEFSTNYAVFSVRLYDINFNCRSKVFGAKTLT